MTREQAIYISEKIKLAIQKIAEEEKLVLTTESLSFNTTSLNLRISAKEIDTSKTSDINTVLSKKYGFTQNIVGMEFSCKNGVFVIVDIKTQNRKYPIIARRKIDGVPYKFHPSNVLKYLGGNNIINRNSNLQNLLD